MITTTAGPSDKQINFYAKLAGERELSIGLELFKKLDRAAASRMIDTALKAPHKAQSVTTDNTIQVDAAPLTPGVYETADGSVYVVKPNREKTHLYAKKMVVFGGDRLMESDEHKNIEFEYAPGAIRFLSINDKMPIERAKELTIRYGRCINCGRHLKNGVSVERGIGPVCAKAFG